MTLLPPRQRRHCGSAGQHPALVRLTAYLRHPAADGAGRRALQACLALLHRWQGPATLWPRVGWGRAGGTRRVRAAHRDAVTRPGRLHLGACLLAFLPQARPRVRCPGRGRAASALTAQLRRSAARAGGAAAHMRNIIITIFLRLRKSACPPLQDGALVFLWCGAACALRPARACAAMPTRSSPPARCSACTAPTASFSTWTKCSRASSRTSSSRSSSTSCRRCSIRSIASAPPRASRACSQVRQPLGPARHRALIARSMGLPPGVRVRRDGDACGLPAAVGAALTALLRMLEARAARRTRQAWRASRPSRRRRRRSWPMRGAERLRAAGARGTRTDLFGRRTAQRPTEVRERAVAGERAAWPSASRAHGGSSERLSGHRAATGSIAQLVRRASPPGEGAPWAHAWRGRRDAAVMRARLSPPPPPRPPPPQPPDHVSSQEARTARATCGTRDSGSSERAGKQRAAEEGGGQGGAGGRAPAPSPSLSAVRYHVRLVGILCADGDSNVAPEVYEALCLLQFRGQDAARRHHRKTSACSSARATGSCATCSRPRASSLSGNVGVGHVRARPPAART